MRLALSGYGRMGRAVEKIASDRGHEILARFDSTHPPSSSTLAGCDAIIDFSTAEAVAAMIEAACEAGVNVVTGTTGWDESRGAVRDRCSAAGITVIYGSNFSPGANVVFALARRASELMAQLEGYEAGIEERHHSKKKDSPSGTALRIARNVAEGSGQAFEPAIASSRVGAEFGLHTLFFDSPDDVIEISHRARGRDAFARGAVLAAERIGQKKGFLSFEELMDW